EFSDSERQIDRGTDAEIGLLCRHRACRVFDLRRRWIDTDDLFGRGLREDQFRERAGTATDVEPVAILWRIGPCEELLADRLTPPAHVAVIRSGIVERDRCFSHGLMLEPTRSHCISSSLICYSFDKYC